MNRTSVPSREANISTSWRKNLLNRANTLVTYEFELEIQTGSEHRRRTG